MILHVLRHGVAEDAPPGGDDAARRLTARGRSKMEEEAAGMRALGLEVDLLLKSPLPRAAETAAIVAAPYRDRPAPRPLPALGRGWRRRRRCRPLRPFARHEHVMVVGHEPGLSRLAALVLTGTPDRLALHLKKGGCIAIELERLAPPSGATLRWLLTGRQLRRVGR
jgi:phosphohistidine phosphatase